MKKGTDVIKVDVFLPDRVNDQPNYKAMKLNAQCFVCGAHLMNGSVNAAMKSGRLAAEAIIQTMH